MFGTGDLGREVKVRQTNSHLVRGFVCYVSPTEADIDTGHGKVRVAYAQISTVTWIDDHSSDRDSAPHG